MTQANDSVTISSRVATIAIVLIIAVAALLRFHDANSQLWYDEIQTLVDSVRVPLASIVTEFPSNNNHVFYSLLAHLSIVMGGDTPLMLRLPAIVFGIASVGLIYSFGREVTGRFEALSAALLAAISYHHLWFSQNARGYTIMLCVTLLSTQLLLVGLRTGKRWPFALFGLVSALGAYTHLTMVLAVCGQAFVVALHLLRRDGRVIVGAWRGPVLGFVTAAAATVLLYLPLLGDVSSFFVDKATTPKAATAGWALLELLHGLSGSLQIGPLAGAALALGGGLFVIGCVSYLRQSPLVLGLFLVPGAVVYFTALMMSRPTFPRFFFFVSGFALLIIVRGVMVTAVRVANLLQAPRLKAPLQLLALVAMVAVLLVDLPRAYGRPKQDYAGAAAFVEATALPGDIIATAAGGAGYPYHRYFAKTWPQVDTAKALATLRQGQNVWVLATFERYLQSGQPDLLAALKTECVPVKRLVGTLADGDIMVSRCPRLPLTITQPLPRATR